MVLVVASRSTEGSIARNTQPARFLIVSGPEDSIGRESCTASAWTRRTPFVQTRHPAAKRKNPAVQTHACTGMRNIGSKITGYEIRPASEPMFETAYSGYGDACG